MLVHCWWEFRWRKTLWRSPPKKLKIELIVWYSNPTSEYIPKKVKPETWRAICILVFIVALLTIAKIWNQPKCESTDEWIKITHTHTHIHTQEYHSAFSVIRDNMDEPGRHYTKWNISIERQTLPDLTYILNLRGKPIEADGRIVGREVGEMGICWSKYTKL